MIYYEPQYMKLTYTFSVRVENGVVKGTADEGTCVPVIEKEELKILPNYNEARVIINRPSLFSSGKFGVTLSDGMLVSVNSESNPEAPEFLQALGAVTAAILVAPPGEGG